MGQPSFSRLFRYLGRESLKASSTLCFRSTILGTTNPSMGILILFRILLTALRNFGTVKYRKIEIFFEGVMHSSGLHSAHVIGSFC